MVASHAGLFFFGYCLFNARHPALVNHEFDRGFSKAEPSDLRLQPGNGISNGSVHLEPFGSTARSCSHVFNRSD